MLTVAGEADPNEQTRALVEDAVPECSRLLPVIGNRTPIVGPPALSHGVGPRPGLRMATPTLRRAWRIVSGLTWNSRAIEAQERPEA